MISTTQKQIIPNKTTNNLYIFINHIYGNIELMNFFLIVPNNENLQLIFKRTLDRFLLPYS